MFLLQDISDENRKKLVAAIEDFCRSNGLNEIQIPFADSTMETIVECLCSIADRMEQRIKQEHTKKYVTDDLEITFMRFCCNCMDLIPVQVLSDEKLIILFKHRHFGYAFFEIGDKTQHFCDLINGERRLVGKANLTSTDIRDMVFGKQVPYEEYGKKPLAKFRHDILKDLGVYTC